MEPTLPAGSLAIARPMDAGITLRAGDVVVAHRPERPGIDIIKRIHSIGADGTIFLVGDNPGASTDSRDFGPLNREQIVARIRWRYWPLPPKRV